MRCHVDGWPTAAYFPVPALGKPAKAAASSPARCSAAPGFLLVFSPFSWVFSQLKNKRKRKKTISSRKLGENPRKLDEKKTAAPPCRWGKKENPYPHLGESRANPLPPICHSISLFTLLQAMGLVRKVPAQWVLCIKNILKSASLPRRTAP